MCSHDRKKVGRKERREREMLAGTGDLKGET